MGCFEDNLFVYLVWLFVEGSCSHDPTVGCTVTKSLILRPRVRSEEYGCDLRVLGETSAGCCALLSLTWLEGDPILSILAGASGLEIQVHLIPKYPHYLCMEEKPESSANLRQQQKLSITEEKNKVAAVPQRERIQH